MSDLAIEERVRRVLFALQRPFNEDREHILQAYVYLNRERLLPGYSQLIAYEEAPYGNHTQYGLCDLILQGPSGAAVIETKVIDTERSGSTVRRRRNRQRSQVVDQVRERCHQFRSWLPELVQQVIATTDPLLVPPAGIMRISVPLSDLRQWHQEMTRLK